MADKFINSFDVWITAQGLKSKGRLKNIDNISSEGVSRLRELILELAIRGRLVPQARSDEDANDLYESIQNEKSRLISEGKFKDQKLLPAVTNDEIPFSLPSKWIWIRLGNVGFTQTGG